MQSGGSMPKMAVWKEGATTVSHIRDNTSNIFFPLGGE